MNLDPRMKEIYKRMEAMVDIFWATAEAKRERRMHGDALRSPYFGTQLKKRKLSTVRETLEGVGEGI